MGEGGLIVTLYTRNTGKLRAVVRGVRKPTSKMVGHLEPLNRVELALASPRPEGIDTITQAQILEGFSSLKASLEAVSRGIYLAELVDGFGAEGSANPELYSLMLDTLRFLNVKVGSRETEESIADMPATTNPHLETELALRYFELHLLKCSGFMPELYRCVECREELSPGKHLFSPEAGGTLCPRCHPTGARIMRLSLQALKVLRFLDRTYLAELPNLHIDRSLGEELKTLLSATLKYWLDKEVQSQKFMEHLENSRKSGVYTGGG